MPSKTDLRMEIQAQIRDYLQSGGEVEEVPKGTSGREPGDRPLGAFRRLFQPNEGGAREPRTSVHDVVIAIEARRKSGKPTRPPRKKPRLRRKPVLDDFGEPVRWVWVEED